MSRRARNQTTVSLFPFLAVLLCAMGALLVLLVITTRQIRDDAIRQAASKPGETSAPPPVETEPEPEYQWPVWEIALGEARELDRRLLPSPPPPALLAPKPVYVKRETDPPPPDLTAALQQLRRQIQLAKTQLAGHRQTAGELQKRRAALLADIEKRETVLKNADQAIAGFQTEGQQLSRQIAALEQNSTAITRELQQLQQQTAALANRPRNTPNVLKVVPYDGQQGTTRRPILIECSGNSIRFVPEGIELTERDLVGFSLTENPLLAGVIAAEKYWVKRDQIVTSSHRPYVLLIVRPDGIPAYYAARQLLQNYEQPSGYELLTADQNLALPEMETEAQQQIARAVQTQLRKRGATPSLARTPFPQIDPEMLERLRSGQDSLRGGLGSESGNAGVQDPGAGTRNPKRFKYVQTSQGLKMVPLDEPELKRFDAPAGARDGFAGNNRSPRTGTDFSTTSPGTPAPPEPAPLPALPEGSRIKTLTPSESNDPQWSKLDPGSRPATSGSPAARADQPYDPTQIPDAWTALLEERRRNRSETSGKSAGQNGNAASNPAAQPSVAQPGINSPFDEAGSLAFKRTIKIMISDKALRIANRDALAIPAGISTNQLMAATVSELRSEVRSWKQPPEKFYWKPAFRFVVYPGGNQFVERLRPAFEEQGLLSGVEYELSDSVDDWRPVQP